MLKIAKLKPVVKEKNNESSKVTTSLDSNNSKSKPVHVHIP